MRLRALLCSSFVSAALTVAAAPAPVQAGHACALGTPSAASYTWNFKGEANSIFDQIRFDTTKTLNDADRLRSLEVDPEVSRETHAAILDDMRDKINDMGAKVCRLEAIRRVLSPWQQHVVDKVAATTQLMVDNMEDAIAICNNNPNEINFPTYALYTRNLYNESQSLTRSVDEAVQYAGVSKEYRNLRSELGARRSS